MPVYRMYNNGQGAAPNHRFTTDFATRDSMLTRPADKAWLAEGAWEGAVGAMRSLDLSRIVAGARRS